MKIETLIRYILHKSVSLNVQILGEKCARVCRGRKRSREKGSDCSTKPNNCKIHHRTVNKTKMFQKPSVPSIPCVFWKVSVRATPRRASIFRVWGGDVGIHQESSIFQQACVYSASVWSTAICRTSFAAPAIIAVIQAVALLYASPACGRPSKIPCIFHQGKKR